jgi:hypothetical protein
LSQVPVAVHKLLQILFWSELTWPLCFSSVFDIWLDYRVKNGIRLSQNVTHWPEVLPCQSKFQCNAENRHGRGVVDAFFRRNRYLCLRAVKQRANCGKKLEHILNLKGVSHTWGNAHIADETKDDVHVLFLTCYSLIYI